MKSQVFRNLPNDFQCGLEGAGCYAVCENKILFVKRHPNRPHGGTWGIPGGKLEKNETPKLAVIREFLEETGVDIASDHLRYFGPLFCRLPHLDYIFHIFYIPLHAFPEVILELEEHLEMKWVDVEEALALPLIVGGVEALEFYREKLEELKKEHFGRE